MPNSRHEISRRAVLYFDDIQEVLSEVNGRRASGARQAPPVCRQFNPKKFSRHSQFGSCARRAGSLASTRMVAVESAGCAPAHTAALGI